MAEASLAGGSARTSLRIKNNRATAFVIAFLVLVLDQATKWVVTYPLQLRHVQTIDVLPPFAGG